MTATPPDDLIGAANNASSQAGKLWITFILLETYLFVTVGGTTHLNLFLETATRLPLLDIDLPLKKFYRYAPLLLILLHLYLLVNTYFLSRTLHLLNPDISNEYRKRQEIDNFVVTQIISGNHDSIILKFFMTATIWISILVGPAFLLLSFQITFLPYHDSLTTMLHRLYLLIDVLLVLVIWPAIRCPGGRFDGAILRTWQWLAEVKQAIANRKNTEASDQELRTSIFSQEKIKNGAYRGLILLICLTVLIFSFLVATIPGELPDRNVRALYPITKYLFEGHYDIDEEHINSIFSRNLILADSEVIDTTKLSSEKRSLYLYKRDLRYAKLDRMNLQKADFSFADLRGASLNYADLESAFLKGVHLENASLKLARLKGAHLDNATLINVNLGGADIIAAYFVGTTMRCTNLSGTNIAWSHFDQIKEMANISMQGAVIGCDNETCGRKKDDTLSDPMFEKVKMDNWGVQGAFLQYVTMPSNSIATKNTGDKDLEAESGVEGSYAKESFPVSDHNQNVDQFIVDPGNDKYDLNNTIDKNDVAVIDDLIRFTPTDADYGYNRQEKTRELLMGVLEQAISAKTGPTLIKKWQASIALFSRGCSAEVTDRWNSR